MAPGGGELPAPERAAAAFQRLWPRQEDGDEAAAADGASAGAGQQQQQKQQGPQRRTAADYRGAYASGAATPSDVAERIISAVEASERLVSECA